MAFCEGFFVYHKWSNFCIFSYLIDGSSEVGNVICKFIDDTSFGCSITIVLFYLLLMLNVLVNLVV